MAPGTLSVIVSDQVFFAAGYHGNKVTQLALILCMYRAVTFIRIKASNYFISMPDYLFLSVYWVLG